MIPKPTTFVVGAGASCCYGLPTSAGLVEVARKLAPRHDVYQLLLAAGTRLDDLRRVLTDLREHPANSLDAFLQTRQGDTLTMTVGRRLIAGLMADALTRSRPLLVGKTGDDWLSYIISRMHPGAPDCCAFANGNSRVRFITFNFDPFIEERLEKAIRSLYLGNEPRQLDAAVEMMCGVVHVHGKLPPLPQVPIGEKGNDVWARWLVEASTQIRVVLDDVDKNVVRTARDIVHGSEVLCFLGFAYDPENLARFDLPGRLPTLRAHSVIFGSAFGLADGEQQSVRRRFDTQISLGTSTQNCLDVLRSFDILRD